MQGPAPSPAKIIRGINNLQPKENDVIILKALIDGNPTPRVIKIINF